MSEHTRRELVIKVPGSKSLTIRALFAAGLASGTSTLVNPLDADDTLAARTAVRAFGAEVDDSGRHWRVIGVAGRPHAPGEVDVGESGLTARILIAVAALARGRTVVNGRGRLPVRPMTGITDALHLMGAVLESERDSFPVKVVGSGTIPGGRITVDSSRSSQFVTAALLVAPFAAAESTVIPVSLLGSDGYVDLTLDVTRAFGGQVDIEDNTYSVTPRPLHGVRFVIEPDASAAVYPFVAAAITGRSVTVAGLDASSHQPDLRVLDVLAGVGCTVEHGSDFTRVTGPGGPLDPIDVDIAAFPDGGVALAVASLFASGVSRLRGVSRLTGKESDRLAALGLELARVGATVATGKDELTIRPGTLKAATIDAHGDHRIAMSFGLLRLVNPDIAVDRPEVVSKTWPGYWDALDRIRR